MGQKEIILGILIIIILALILFSFYNYGMISIKEGYAFDGGGGCLTYYLNNPNFAEEIGLNCNDLKKKDGIKKWEY
jgi:hypothetical protein